MRKKLFISSVALVLSIILKPTLITAQQSSEPPNEGKAARSQSHPRKETKNANEKSNEDLRGTDSSPITVKVLPTPKTEEEATQEKHSRQDQSLANWSLVILTGVIMLIAALQTIVFGRQARRLKETITKMDEIASGQTADMKASIAEATRAASAMEGIAASMSANVASVQESVEITRGIADRQKLISELQSRAYISVEFFGMVPQNTHAGIRFEPRVVAFNRGHTPAYKVRYRSRADITRFPVPDDFSFDLPDNPQGGSVGIIAAGTNKILSAVVPNMYADQEIAEIKAGGKKRLIMWGEVTYEDAFGIERFARFGLTFFLAGGWENRHEQRHYPP